MGHEFYCTFDVPDSENISTVVVVVKRQSSVHEAIKKGGNSLFICLNSFQHPAKKQMIRWLKWTFNILRNDTDFYYNFNWSRDVTSIFNLYFFTSLSNFRNSPRWCLAFPAVLATFWETAPRAPRLFARISRRKTQRNNERGPISEPSSPKRTRKSEVEVRQLEARALLLDMNCE